MTAKEKAESLVNEFRVILMNEDTDCGHEILCTKIAKKCSFICVDEIISQCEWYQRRYSTPIIINFWQDVKSEIEKL